MTITASRVDDLLKQRDEYDARLNELKSRRDGEDAAYQSAQYDAEKAVERKIMALIGPTTLDIRVDVNQDWTSRGNSSVILWKIRIDVNERRKFKDDTSLVWSWSVGLSNGVIRKESSSWSGLQAVTPEQIADLEESVKVIKTLNAIDWDEIIHAPTANYRDYHDSALYDEYNKVSKERPDFEGQIRDEKLLDAIGKDIAFALKQDQYWKGKCWIIPTKISDKFISGYIFPDYYLSRNYSVDEIKKSADERRTAKANLIRDWDTNEYETVDFSVV